MLLNEPSSPRMIITFFPSSFYAKWMCMPDLNTSGSVSQNVKLAALALGIFSNYNLSKEHS